MQDAFGSRGASKPEWRGWGGVLATAALLVMASVPSACGSGSNSEVQPPGSGPGAPAGAGPTAGSGGSSPVAGSGGSMPGAGGSAGTGGSGPVSGADAGSSAGACPPQPGWTWGVRQTLDVSWPASTAGLAGTGKIVNWTKIKVSASGNTLTGEVQTCGNVLPESNLSGLGSLAAGGGKILIEVPHTVWEAPGMPRFPVEGSQTGWDMGSTVKMSWSTLYGVTLADPVNAPWPASSRMSMGVTDVDGDGSPGFTATPRSGGGYVLPPTAIGLGGSAPAAERVHLVLRTVIGLEGGRTSCDDASGRSMVKFLDSHVVGCQVRGGMPCNATQTDFLDSNRTIFMVRSAAFESKKVADGASCADVRTALPM